MRFGVSLLGCFALTAAGCGGEPTNTEDGTRTHEEPACEGRGEPIVLGMSKQSDDGLLTVSLTEAEPRPPVQGINHWTVDVSKADGPVVDEGDADSEVIANIFMVDHDHNIRKRGTMTSPGIFEIADFTITMNGYWEVTVEVQPDASEGADDIEATVFGFCVSN